MIMSTMVAVTVALTLPCVMLGEQPPADVYDRGRLSVVSDLRAPPMFARAGPVQEIPHPIREVDYTRTAHPITDNGPNHSHRSSILTDTLESKKNVSTDLENSTHDDDVTDEDLEEMENQNYGNGWTTIFRPEQSFVAELTPLEMSESVGGSSETPSGIVELNSSSEYYDNRLDPPTRQITMRPGLNEYFAPSIGTYFGTQPLILPNGETSVLVSGSAPNPQVPITNPQVPITNPQVPIINTDSSNLPNVQSQTSNPQQHNMMVISTVNWQRVGKITHMVLGSGYFTANTPVATTATVTGSSSSSIASPLNSGQTTIIPGSATKTRSLI